MLIRKVGVASSPGPFPAFQWFSVCNIEKLGMGLGTRLGSYVAKSMTIAVTLTPQPSTEALQSLLLFNPLLSLTYNT